VSIFRKQSVTQSGWIGLATCILLSSATMLAFDDAKKVVTPAPAKAAAPPPPKPAAAAPQRTVSPPPNTARPNGAGAGGTRVPNNVPNNNGAAGRPTNGVGTNPAVGNNPARGVSTPSNNTPNNVPSRSGGWNNNPNNQPNNQPARNGGLNNNPNTRPGSATPNVPGQNVNAPNRGGLPSNRAGSAAGVSHDPGFTRGPNGRVQSYRSPNGSEAQFRRDGSVHEVRARGMTITHGPGGTRRIMSERPDHSLIVTNRAGHGYVQRPFNYGGHAYASRTYYYRGAAYPRYYRTYSYRGVYLQTYAPARYYSPAFYGWAYYPWATPVYYSWGFASAPWYGYYGGYFAPYQSYPSASYWLTDYLVAQSLTAAYQEQVDASANMQGSAFVGGNGQTALTPDVKQEIANEVQRQLTLENAERKAVSENTEPDPASSGIPRLLSDNTPHSFVVASNLVVTDSTGQECPITQGDVILMSGTSLADGNMVPVQVRASKNQECTKGSMVSVSLEDLQDMENHMRGTIDQGLAELQSHPAQNGLPALPAAAAVPPVQAAFAAAAPAVDANVSTELSQEAHNADQIEQQVVTESQSAQSPDNSGNVSVPLEPQASQPPTISLGQTIAQVVVILGNPLQIADLGSKKIYKFKDMKITFINGKVSDVQ
jgi:hypothetical protein